MKAVILLFSVFLYTSLFSQKKFVGEVKKIPMINGKAYDYNSPPFEPGDPGDPGLVIRSNEPNIYAIAFGEVRAVFDVGDGNVAVIRSSTNTFYAYTNFDTIYFSKGCRVRKGDLLGKGLLNSETHLFECTVFIINSEGNYLNENKIFEIIIKADNDFHESDFEIIAKY
jgi:hypothetical protein